MDKISQDELRQECRFLCKSVFKVTPSQATLDRFVAAYQILFVESAEEEASSSRFDAVVRDAVKRGQDVEALEYALRSRAEVTVLTKKLHMLLYIIETQPLHHNLFVNAEDSVLKGYGVLGYEIVRSMYKLLKGHIMLYFTRRAE